MVSFRVSPEEYRRLREACSSHGARSVSDLARTAMSHLMDRHDQSGPVTLDLQVQHLRERIESLASELDGLSRTITIRRGAAVGT